MSCRLRLYLLLQFAFYPHVPVLAVLLPSTNQHHRPVMLQISLIGFRICKNSVNALGIIKKFCILSSSFNIKYQEVIHY